ncbi:MAG TPA: hypothetical protein QF509_05560 [Rhodospirillales bacterium]|nr:hypothetical protein [Rhodospirillales bacterium]
MTTRFRRFAAAAKDLGEGAIDSLVFLAIAFSHHVLINCLKKGAKGFANGFLTDKHFPDRKSFINLENDIEELGFVAEANEIRVRYDLRELFENPKFAPLAAELFRLKLIDAGWDEPSPFIEECVAHRFHNALSVSDDFFRSWLLGGVQVSTDAQAKFEQALACPH